MDAVLNWLWQGCVVALAWCAMLHVLERARANVRYMVSWAALLLIVAALPALPWLQSTTAPADAVLVMRSNAIVSLPATWWTSTLVMRVAWLTWATVCTVRLVFAMVALRRARKRSRPFPPRAESFLSHWNRVRVAGRGATLVLSDSVSTASVLGWGRPMIAVAPSLVERLEAGELDRVLIHEWAHVQRRDDLGHILQLVVRALAGWHPAVWWIDRRLHIEREMACDEITVTITDSPKSYAECLLKLASLRRPARTVQAAPAVFTPSSLRARVIKIVSPRRWMTPVWSRTLAAATVSTLSVMSVSVGGLKLIESTAFALPFESASGRMVSATQETIPPVVAPPSKPVESTHSARQTGASKPSAEHPTAKRPSSSPSPSPSSLPVPEPETPRTPAAVNAPETSPAAAQNSDDQSGTSQMSTVLSVPEKQPSEVTTEHPQSPWSAAADGGSAVGRKSKQAGVATAGFFTRFARRVAGSF